MHFQTEDFTFSSCKYYGVYSFFLDNYLIIKLEVSRRVQNIYCNSFQIVFSYNIRMVVLKISQEAKCAPDMKFSDLLQIDS